MKRPAGAREQPPVGVLRAFGIEDPPGRLEGGQGRAWIAGDVVLKPCDAPEEWSWLAVHLPTVRPEGFRLASAVEAEDGSWVVDGWCAQRRVPGSHPDGPRWVEVLAVCERLDRALRVLPRPSFLDIRDDPWTRGDLAAWGEAPAPDHPLVAKLVAARRGVGLDSQLVHGDMAENVLFAEGRPPAVIDVSPYWRPAGFASAVVVADAVCWRRADPAILLQAAAHLAEFPQLLVRALIYRMTTSVELAVGRPDLEGYRPAVDLALRLVEGR